MIDFMKIHPMTTLLGGTGNALSNVVHMSDEMAVSFHGYITDSGIDIEKYYQEVERLKKQRKTA